MALTREELKAIMKEAHAEANAGLLAGIANVFKSHFKPLETNPNGNLEESIAKVLDDRAKKAAEAEAAEKAKKRTGFW